ncbi:putative OTU-like cysteine protease [Aspergillus clavatus NRRL 1]|uniref:OTU-like cysteine protease, putative n=1 Tax=Aspergillus clavatus (strain ATCC 1007 / CBS 513.65 / DSM 816 / NCTC 3887 / NRRL 1 / QM 1276 / 107) TaxID=344612 RepID=A1CB83_ASPCL|nr:OTU-like cysteine protease, putative [Aspergillus clavatus NRRL 1]EAW13001.1 OTU-like cysteine protease, putative [Aspergillus clavatus NRRL 1]
MAQVMAPISPLHLSVPSQKDPSVKRTRGNPQQMPLNAPCKKPSPEKPGAHPLSPTTTKPVPRKSTRRTSTLQQSTPQESSSQISTSKKRSRELDPECLRIPCLNELGLYAFPTKGDGNCLYYALSDQMFGNTEHADEIRLRLANHISTHKDYFINFIAAVGGERRAPRRAAASRYSSSSSSSSSASPAPPSAEDIERSFESKLEESRKNGTWGGSEDIQAFCQSFKVDIRVYSTRGIQTFRDVYASRSEERPILHIAFHDFNHYSSVRHVDGPHIGLPRIPTDLKSGGRSSHALSPVCTGAKRSVDESEEEEPRPAVRRKRTRMEPSKPTLTMKLRSQSPSRALSPSCTSTKRSTDESVDEDPRPAVRRRRTCTIISG